MNNRKTRDPALDIIRCIALLSVICVHFFLNTSFYDDTVAGIPMLIMTVMRSSFLICVPLFLMLTGYLVQSKEPSKKYYHKITRILYVYLITSLICGLFGIFFLGIYTVPSAILGILSFETAPYAWYIEMYLGFFLLIPFLNTMYDVLQTQKKKQVLIVTLLLLTALPSVLNIYNLYAIFDLNWWAMPSRSPNCVKIVPDWWANLYPVTYFFLGKYLREYSIKYKPSQLAVWAILVFLFAGIFNYYRSYGGIFIWGPWQVYSSLLVTAQSVLVFSFFLKLDCSRLPAAIQNMFAKISDISLGAYLISWIFDSIVYTRLNDAIPTLQQKLIWFPVTVTLVLAGSLMCAYLIDLSYSLIAKKRI